MSHHYQLNSSSKWFLWNPVCKAVNSQTQRVKIPTLLDLWNTYSVNNQDKLKEKASTRVSIWNLFWEATPSDSIAEIYYHSVFFLQAISGASMPDDILALAKFYLPIQ